MGRRMEVYYSCEIVYCVWRLAKSCSSDNLSACTDTAVLSAAQDLVVQ